MWTLIVFKRLQNRSTVFKSNVRHPKLMLRFLVLTKVTPFVTISSIFYEYNRLHGRTIVPLLLNPREAPEVFQKICIGVG